MLYKIAATSALVAGLVASNDLLLSDGAKTIIFKISALPAGIKNSSGIAFTSLYF